MTDTPVLRLRAVEPRDIDFMLRWENDPELWDYSDFTAPVSSRILREYIDSYTADPWRDGQLRLMADLDADTVGIADLYRLDPVNAHGFIGIFTAPGFRRRGLGVQMVEQLCALAFTRLGLRQLCALVADGNVASLALFARCGFAVTGRLRQWTRTAYGFRDVIVLQREAPE